MLDRRTTVTVSFDGEDYDGYAGESVLECARRNGVTIPSLCFLEGLSVWGGCRICVVEVAEDHRLRPACATPVAADIEVKTETPRLRAYRKSILELLFAEGNHVCAVCVANNHCELQNMADELGVKHFDLPVTDGVWVEDGGESRRATRSEFSIPGSLLWIDVATDDHLWAETYDQELTAANIFAIQSDVARQIASALEATQKACYRLQHLMVRFSHLIGILKRSLTPGSSCLKKKSESPSFMQATPKWLK